MRRRLRSIEARVLPRGWPDVIRQVMLFVGAYVLYELVRGAVSLFGDNVYKPFGDATKIINLERLLHVFVEPSIQGWASSTHWLMDLADWSYINAHYIVTGAALIFIYLRRNSSFYYVRNMFMVAMAIALVGYFLYPTAPPRLMPEWGFTDSIRQFTGITVDQGPGSAFLNLYAAVPSIHVCFAILTGWPMARLVSWRPAKIAWVLYPLWISFVVIATGNHYLTDVFLGALTAFASVLVAQRFLSTAPHVWTASRQPATARALGGEATAEAPA